MAFNPFEKPIGTKLFRNDLDLLVSRSVAEGYFVEYKREFPQSNSKIAHSVAALANTYGGWYFVGVETDANHVATRICGYDKTAIRDGVDKIREIIKSHITPRPVCFAQVVEIDQARAALAVHVPAEQDTPFISSDGRVYRRSLDSSDPVAERDRYAVDRITDIGKGSLRRFQDFCVDDRDFDDFEQSTAGVSIFISPYPSGLFDRRELTTLSGISKLLELGRVRIWESRGFARTQHFDHAAPTGDSVLMQVRRSEAEPQNWQTTEFFTDGSARFHMAFRPAEQFQDVTNIHRHVSASSARMAFEHRPNGGPGLEELGIVVFDLRQILLLLGAGIGFYAEWLDSDRDFVDFRFAILVRNAWRHMAFLDSTWWGHHVSRHDYPMLTRGGFSVPRHVGGGFLWSHDQEITLWRSVCIQLGLALGIPPEVLNPTLDEISELNTDW